MPVGAMSVTFFDRQDLANPLNGSVLDAELDLEIALSRLAEGGPAACELVGPGGRTLWIGLSGELGYVQYRAGGAMPARLMAAARGSRHAEGAAELLIGDTPTVISNRYQLPRKLVLETAAFFLRTGGLNPDLTWETV